MTQHNHSVTWRKVVAFAAIPAASALVLSGCSAPAEESGPVTITIAVQTQTNETKPYSEIVDAFVAENPDITVNVVETPNDSFAQVIKTQLQAGNAPDVIYGSPGTGNPNSLGNYAAAGYLVDLSSDDWATSSVPESAKSLYVDADGAQFALPLDVAPIPLVINQTAFEEVGIEPATTFDDLIAQCSVVRDAGKLSLISLSGSTPPNTGIMALELSGPRVYVETPDWNEQRAAGDVTFADSQGWKDTLQAILDLSDNGCFQDGAEGGTFDTLFNDGSSGNSLSFFAPAGAAADLKSINPAADFSVVAFPGDKESDEFIFASPSNALGINAASTHIDAAKKLLEYWAQASTQDAFAELTGNASLASVLTGAPVADRFSNIEQYLTDPAKNAPLANLFWPNGEVYNQLGTGVQGLLTGQATIDQVLTAMDDAWDNN